MKKANVYNMMRSNNNGATKGSNNLAKNNFYFIKFVLSQKLEEEGLFDYVENGIYDKETLIIEEYVNNFNKCVLATIKEEQQEDVENELVKWSNQINENCDYKTLVNYAPSENKLSEIARVMALYMRRTKDFHKTCDEYIKKYIIPILEKLNAENKIVFDVNSKDGDISLKTNNTLKIFSILVREKGSPGAYLKYCIGEFREDFYDAMKKNYFLYVDDEKYKQDIAQQFCNNFLNGYDKLDLINIDSFNSVDFYSIEGMDL